MNKTQRAFIAIPLPEVIIGQIRVLGEEIKNHGLAIRWVKPDNIHLTLKFLGDISEEVSHRVQEEIKKTAGMFSPPTLVAKGLGVFPGIKAAKVMWVGVAGDLELLAQIQSELETKLEAIGIPKEKRPFKGHLTIGRMKRRIDPRKLADAIRSNFSSGSFEAEGLALYKSELKPSGAEYTRLGSAVFGRKKQ